MKRIITSAAVMMFAIQVPAQDSTKAKPVLTISGYAEAYYLYDFNRPLHNARPVFVYSHNRTNEISLNLGFIKAAYITENVRANLTLAAGTYMNANLAAEPGVLKNISEANAGVKISKSSELWVDAGILPSHIGIESAIGKDNWTLTRSIVADNSPYYEAGARLSYTTKNNRWYLAALYLNGWQRIQRVDGNTTPAFGTQVTYKPSSAVTLNYSTFIGNDKPDSGRLMRYYQNLYGIFQLSDKFGITLGFDYGMEQKAKGSSGMNSWYTPLLLLRINPNSKNGITFRGEYFKDNKEVIIETGTANGFETFGWSINYDRNITSNAVWRIEVRSLNSKDPVFVKRDLSSVRNNTFITTALAISLNE